MLSVIKSTSMTALALAVSISSVTADDSEGIKLPIRVHFVKGSAIYKSMPGREGQTFGDFASIEKQKPVAFSVADRESGGVRQVHSTYEFKAGDQVYIHISRVDIVGPRYVRYYDPIERIREILRR